MQRIEIAFVIASESEAIHSSAYGAMELLRRFAPRNDDG
jgi:hypothetical protein